MSEQNFKDFAVAYSIMKLMDSGKPMRTNEFAKQLDIGFNTAKRVVAQMSRNNLIFGKRGFNSDGFRKTEGVEIKDVFNLYNVDETEDLQAKITKVLSTKKFQIKRCSVCECEIRFRSEDGVCKSCRRYEEAPYTETRIARCGHPSSTRYFKCTACLPFLPSEEFEDTNYIVHSS